ncbi:MAG: MFS transporter [Gammaproteobacteria bacterium]|nr:MFS transporter [Gammaproteobacteria bacterium]
MTRRFAKDPQINDALRHSVKDGVAYSVMAGAGETYFSAFALFFKATTTQIGLLASLPPLISSLSQLFSAWLSYKTFSRKKVILTGASFQAFVWLPLILLPYFFQEQAVGIIIACIIVYHAASSIVLPYWSSLMGDLVPERRRGRYFALRTRYTSISALISLIVAGIILHIYETHELALYGFISIFVIAGMARWISVYHLTHLVEPSEIKTSLDIKISGHWWHQLKHSRFFHFSVFFGLMQTAVATASPFFAVYMLRDLHFTYVQFMTLSAATVLMQFLTLNGWGRISDMFGNRLVLITAGFIVPLIPALWLVSNSIWYLFAVQLLSGFVWAGFNLSAGNYLYDLIPAPKRSTYLAYHNVITNIGVFSGALMGGFLGASLPNTVDVFGETYHWQHALLGVFLISALLRLSVALVFLPRLKEVRTVKQMTVTELIFRATRFSALSGFIYDIISSVRHGKK